MARGIVFPIIWVIAAVIAIIVYKKLMINSYRLRDNILSIFVLYPFLSVFIVMTSYFIFPVTIMDYEWYRPLWSLFMPILFAFIMIRSSGIANINFNILGVHVTNKNFASTFLLMPITLPIISILLNFSYIYYADYLEKAKGPQWYYLERAKPSVSHPYAGVWKHWQDSVYAVGPNNDGTYYVAYCNNIKCRVHYESTTLNNDESFIIKSINVILIRFLGDQYKQYNRFILEDNSVAQPKITDYIIKAEANESLNIDTSR